MKTKEFVKGVKGYGYSVVDFGVVYAIFSEFGYLIAYVSKVTRCEFELYYKKELGRELFSLIVIYTATPIEDREKDTKDKLLNEINRILNYVKDFDNKGLIEILNGIEKLEDDLEIFANDLKCGLVEVEE